MTQFSGQFDSFCNLHVPDFNKGKKHGSEYCLVCIERLDAYHPADSIISSCCLELSDWNKCFVHKKCALHYVKNAGYDSMCINCPMDKKSMTKEKWQNEMRQKGVFVPMIEAVWEREGQFSNQVKNKCKSDNCPNPQTGSNVWTCFVCGCFPSHLKCAKVRTPEEYYCPKCYDQSFVQRVPRFWETDRIFLEVQIPSTEIFNSVETCPRAESFTIPNKVLQKKKLATEKYF